MKTHCLALGSNLGLWVAMVEAKHRHPKVLRKNKRGVSYVGVQMGFCF